MTSRFAGAVGAVGAAGGQGEPLERFLVDNTYVEWSVKVQAGSGSVSGPFVMGFHLDAGLEGEADVDVGVWTVLMAAMAPEDVKKKMQHADTLPKFSGMVSLTASLMDEVAARRLRSLDAEHVVPFLQERLTWRMQTVCYGLTFPIAVFLALAPFPLVLSVRGYLAYPKKYVGQRIPLPRRRLIHRSLQHTGSRSR
jgi:hypothetical protein